MISLTPGKLWGMRRMANRAGLFAMTAVDQRPPIKNPIAEHYGTEEAPYNDVAEVKFHLIEALQDQSTAMLLDPHYAIPRGVDSLSPEKGLIVTLEDSVFVETPGGRISSTIDHWTVEKIKRMGGDAVKLLVWYRPDADDDVVQKQKEFTLQIGEDCARYDIPFLLELLVYPLAVEKEQTADYIEMANKKSDLVLQSVEEFARPDYGVDVFKLESPINAGDVPETGTPGWDQVQEIFKELGRLANRPWIMLSAGANKSDFRNILSHACLAGASGYLAGRAIWMDAFQNFPDWEAFSDQLKNDSISYMNNLNDIVKENASPWYEHSCYGEFGSRFQPPDQSFRSNYEGFENI